ncbi:PREDICTED: SHC-transforming protein 1 isoform X3 [Corvus brachyrhynchos]|uniref:SHC-transforming protein 1 isoform X3 n=2 Tax=Corvus TaxID=30420 RepID=UPI000816523F|nr:PREDICTED: SHC-transforming protein 1 isoform X3 [Corvus brachyrhynchos]XP_031949528.1 SHC-transforming protein 1 isoform X3 [Corvus moneduloides]XP_041890414.1 SHC-transforming protein 1 isoform X3 [Corvus kubaryi]
MFLSQRITAPSSRQWEEGGFQVSLTPCVSSLLHGSHSPIHLWTAWRSRVCLLAPWPPPQRAGTGLANSLFVPEPQVGVPDERGCVSLLPARGLPCPPPAMEYVDMNKLSCGKKTRVEGGQLGGDEWTRHGSFVNKPTRGWLHPDDKVMGSGVSYHVRYMGCVEVLQSMRALDFNTRTQVTREAIGLVCEAVPGAKGAVRRRKPCSRSLNSILGKSNLKFAGMPITLTISTSSLNLMASDCKQIIANHHMQSISFASGGDPDTAEYVAYVAKDPVNQRACHILECPEGLAQDVISTIGQAFELRFKQYLKNPPKLVTPHDRMAGFDGSAWDEEEEEPAPDHQYYNDFPGKEPPIGGVVDMRLQDGAAQTPNHLGATLPVGQSSGGEYDAQKQHTPAQAGREKYAAPAGTPGRTDLFDDPSYVNVQNIDKTRQASAAGATANGSTQRDLFDMKPFEDALRVPPSVPVGLPPAQVVASMEEQLRREPWYHGKMNRKEAEKLLKVNGDFLVRESTTTPGQYVLTGLQGGQPKHLLLVDPEGVVRTKDHRFESVSHLISYHMDNHLPIISAGSEMCLQQPVERRL